MYAPRQHPPRQRSVSPARTANSENGILSNQDALRLARSGHLFETEEERRDRETQTLIDSLTRAFITPNMLESESIDSGEPQLEEEVQNEHDLSAAVPASRFRRFALSLLPSSLMNSRVLKKITALQVRPKIQIGGEYRSVGDFTVHHIQSSEVFTICNHYKDISTQLISALDGVIDNNSFILDNIRKVDILSQFIGDVAKDMSDSPIDHNNHCQFYQMKRKGDDDVYALAMLSTSNGTVSVEGVVVHPLALISRMDVQQRERMEDHSNIKLGKFDVRGIGQAISIMSVMKTLKSRRDIHSIKTEAVNVLSARIFARATKSKS